LTHAALAVALALLTESFGRDVLWLWRHRFAERAQLTDPSGPLRLQRP
jgi:hypothetical protein